MDKRRVFKYVADIFLPNRCCFCDTVISWDRLACRDCIAKQETVDEAEVGVEGTQGSFCAFRFKGRTRELIYELKHTGRVNTFAELSAKLICEKIRRSGAKIDVVTFVPMYRGKRMKRGYDQAEVIARYVGEELEKPMIGGLIGRTSDSAQQHHMNAKERKEHAEQIFFKNECAEDISGKNVLICDDVITTGSTMRVCAALLKEMGAQVIYCCSAAASILEDA